MGRYRLIELIGRGGMGEVRRAHVRMMRRDVTIKLMPTELTEKHGYQERFEREAYTEPHIIPIDEAGEIDGRLHLAMPVIDGIDLQKLLARDRPMSPQQAVKVLEQLTGALNAARGQSWPLRDPRQSIKNPF